MSTFSSIAGVALPHLSPLGKGSTPSCTEFIATRRVRGFQVSVPGKYKRPGIGSCGEAAAAAWNSSTTTEAQQEAAVVAVLAPAQPVSAKVLVIDVPSSNNLKAGCQALKRGVAVQYCQEKPITLTATERLTGLTASDRSVTGVQLSRLGLSWHSETECRCDRAAVLGSRGTDPVRRLPNSRTVMSILENRMRWHFATQACRRPLGVPARNLRTAWFVRCN
ncbi:hypothetical protein QBC45DRAFT_484702 [Copromyces sp. CBS 386.78]|nr:hypothetical protein QBC45DRAFT_484702 [Copromyces sp. CBS 386.78]